MARRSQRHHPYLHANADRRTRGEELYDEGDISFAAEQWRPTLSEYPHVAYVPRHNVLSLQGEEGGSGGRRESAATTVQPDGRITARETQERYSTLAAAAYQNANADKVGGFLQKHTQQVGGYVLDTELSSKKDSVFINPNTHEVVISFRGTDITNMEDLYDDSQILAMMQNENATGRFKRAEQLYERVRQKYSSEGGTEIKVTGHSLGGAIAMYVGEKHDIEVHAFNPGISAMRALENHRKNTHTSYVYRTGFDPVSIGAKVNQDPNRKIIRVKQTQTFDPHGIKNFMAPEGGGNKVAKGAVNYAEKKTANKVMKTAEDAISEEVKLAYDATMAIETAKNGMDDRTAHMIGLDKIAQAFESGDQKRERVLDHIEDRNQKSGDMAYDIDGDVVTVHGVRYVQVSGSDFHPTPAGPPPSIIPPAGPSNF